MASAGVLACSAGACAVGKGPGSVNGTPDGGIQINGNYDASRRPPPFVPDAPGRGHPVADAVPKPTRVDAAPGMPTPDAFLPPPPPDAAPPPDAVPNRPPDAKPPCTTMTIDLLQNGNFDSGPGDPPWAESSLQGGLSSGYELVASSSDLGFTPDTGNFAAWLGGDVDLNDQLGQTVKVPADATKLELTGKLFFFTAETDNTTVFDQGGIGLFDTGGNVLETLALFDNTGASTSNQVNWTAFSKTASKSYAGQTIQLGFQSQNDVSNPTSFYFDSLKLLATVCR